MARFKFTERKKGKQAKKKNISNMVNMKKRRISKADDFNFVSEKKPSFLIRRLLRKYERALPKNYNEGFMKNAEIVVGASAKQIFDDLKILSNHRKSLVPNLKDMVTLKAMENKDILFTDRSKFNPRQYLLNNYGRGNKELYKNVNFNANFDNNIRK